MVEVSTATWQSWGPRSYVALIILRLFLLPFPLSVGRGLKCSSTSSKHEKVRCLVLPCRDEQDIQDESHQKLRLLLMLLPLWLFLMLLQVFSIISLFSATNFSRSQGLQNLVQCVHSLCSSSLPSCGPHLLPFQHHFL